MEGEQCGIIYTKIQTCNNRFNEGGEVGFLRMFQTLPRMNEAPFTKKLSNTGFLSELIHSSELLIS